MSVVFIMEKNIMNMVMRTFPEAPRHVELLRMRPAEFEEKEYEELFYRQLYRGLRCWTPGQVLEASLGFDFAAPLVHPFLLAVHGIDRPFAGIGAVARQLQHRALFVYAAPVFARSRELFAHATAATIVPHSTFPDAQLLSGHKAFYYNSPGNSGLLNDGYERVEFPSLEDRVGRLRAEITDDSANTEESLERFGQALAGAVAESGDGVRNVYLSEEWRDIEAEAERSAVPALIKSFLRVDAFAR